SPNCSKMVRKLLITLQEIMPTFAILGNHDLNLSNSQHDDMFTGLFEPVHTKPINLHLLVKEGLYHYKNITFAVSSIINGNKPLSAIKTDRYLIALYHGTIYGSSNDQNF